MTVDQAVKVSDNYTRTEACLAEDDETTKWHIMIGKVLWLRVKTWKSCSNANLWDTGAGLIMQLVNECICVVQDKKCAKIISYDMESRWKLDEFQRNQSDSENIFNQRR